MITNERSTGMQRTIIAASLLELLLIAWLVTHIASQPRPRRSPAPRTSTSSAIAQ